MKKLASLLKINGLVRTYGYAHTVYSFLYLNLNKKIIVVSTAVSTLNLVVL